MKQKLIHILSKLVTSEDQFQFKKSGNIELKLKDMGEENAIKIADSYYLLRAKEDIVYRLGVILGQSNLTKKPIYRFKLRNNCLYFIGTEAEILKKIEEHGSKEEKDIDIEDINKQIQKELSV